MTDSFLPLCPIAVYTPSQIQVDFNPQLYNRTSTNVEGFIEDLWIEKLEFAQKNNKILFNASKFRLHDVQVLAADCDSQATTLVVKLGLTDYKSFVGLNAALEQGLLDIPATTISSSACSFPQLTSHFANVLGVESCLMSSDNKCVLFRRSHAVAEYTGAFAFPGGHPEPARCKLSGSIVRPEGETDSSHSVRDEFFSSAVDEIIAEAGIPREKILERDTLRLIGITVPRPDQKRGGKPVACFVVRSSCCMSEMLQARFGAEEKEEFDHSKILVVESQVQARDLLKVRERGDSDFFTPATAAILLFLGCCDNEEKYLREK